MLKFATDQVRVALRTLPKNESGATAIEYTLLVAVVGMVIAGSFPTVTTAITALLGRVAGTLG
jgi:Flp pilus assembly pilin Flp